MSKKIINGKRRLDSSNQGDDFAPTGLVDPKIGILGNFGRP